MARSAHWVQLKKSWIVGWSFLHRSHVLHLTYMPRVVVLLKNHLADNSLWLRIQEKLTNPSNGINLACDGLFLSIKELVVICSFVLCSSQNTNCTVMKPKFKYNAEKTDFVSGRLLFTSHAWEWHTDSLVCCSSTVFWRMFLFTESLGYYSPVASPASDIAAYSTVDESAGPSGVDNSKLFIIFV